MVQMATAITGPRIALVRPAPAQDSPVAAGALRYGMAAILPPQLSSASAGRSTSPAAEVWNSHPSPVMAGGRGSIPPTRGLWNSQPGPMAGGRGTSPIMGAGDFQPYPSEVATGVGGRTEGRQRTPLPNGRIVTMPIRGAARPPTTTVAAGVGGRPDGRQRTPLPSGRGVPMLSRGTRPPTTIAAEGPSRRLPPPSQQSLAREMAAAYQQRTPVPSGPGGGGSLGIFWTPSQAGRGRGGGGGFPPARPCLVAQPPSPSATQRGGLRGSANRIDDDTAAEQVGRRGISAGQLGREHQQGLGFAQSATAAVTTADARQLAASSAATLTRLESLAGGRAVVAPGGSGSDSSSTTTTTVSAAQPHRIGETGRGGFSSYQGQGRCQTREAAPSPEMAAGGGGSSSSSSRSGSVVSAAAAALPPPPVQMPPLALPMVVHSAWVPITIGTAKCDFCPDGRRQAFIQRCADCGTQCCQACWQSRRDHPDTQRAGANQFYFTRTHIMDDDINWTRPSRRREAAASASARRARKTVVRARNSET